MAMIDAPFSSMALRSQGRKVGQATLLTILVAICIGALAGFISTTSRDDILLLKVTTGLTLGGFVFYMLTWKWLDEPLFMPFPVFLTAAYVYHFGQLVIFLFGYETGRFGNDNTLNLFRFTPATLQNVALISWLGISALQVGALIATRRHSLRNTHFPLGQETVQRGSPALTVGLFLAAAAFIPAMLNLFQTLAFRSTGTLAGYVSQHEQVGVADPVSVIAQALLPGLLFAAAGASKRKWVLWMVVGFCAFWFAAYTAVGDRSTGMLPLVAVLWLYNTVYKQINGRVLLAVMAVLMFVVNPLVALTRNASSLEDLSGDTLVSTVSGIDNPLVLALDETGISAIPLADTLELVPESRPHAFGTGYIQNLAIGPFSFFFGGSGEGEYGVPAYWLIKSRYPERLSTSSFLGFSYIAETYLEFGYFGFLVSGLLGYVLVYGTAVAVRRRSAFLLGAQAILLLYLIHFSRGDSGGLGRPIVRYVLIPIGMMLFVEWLNRERTGREVRVR